jgi:hypothetical protein
MEAGDPMDDIDAYESMEVSSTEDAPPSPEGEGGGQARGWQSRSADAGDRLSAVDEGWSLDAPEDAWPTSRDGADTLSVAASPGVLEDLSDFGASPPPEAWSARDEGTGEVTLPAMRRRASIVPLSADQPADDFDRSDFDPPSEVPGPTGVSPDGGATDSAQSEHWGDGPTTQHRAIAPSLTDPVDDEDDHDRAGDAMGDGDGEYDGDTVNRRVSSPDPLEDGALSFEDETRERPSLRAMGSGPIPGSLDPAVFERDIAPSHGRAGSEGDSGVHDPDADRETTQLYQRDPRMSQPLVAPEILATELEAELDDAVPLDPSLGDEAVKARMSWLIERASRESQAGRFLLAVVALDLALEEHADSAVAQKLIHSNRELLFEVYRNFLGDPTRVPQLPMPMHRMPVAELDHRAAFLLSRVDGSLTIEDVLDVSGMARLDALRHVVRLLLRGLMVLR